MAAGAYYFLRPFEKTIGPPLGVVHGCPCGCGKGSALFFRGLGGGRQEWDVTGAWPNVTLSPSIGIKPVNDGVYHWHGYLRDGVFEEC